MTEDTATQAPDRDDVMEALENVIDPELGLDFVSLGLVYDVEVEGSEVHITFTLTSPGCPIGPQVTEQMKEFVSEVEGVEKVFPKMVFSPPWSPEPHVRGREVRPRVLGRRPTSFLETPAFLSRVVGWSGEEKTKKRLSGRDFSLREPHGFAGRCFVVELAVAQDLAVAESDHDEDPAAHGCPASRPATMLTGSHQYVVATVDESFRLGAVLVPLVEPSLEGFAHAVVTAVDTGIGPLRVFVPLDLGIAGLGDQLGQRREQCLLVHVRAGCEEPLHELDVLLRHRSRSIASMSEDAKFALGSAPADSS